MDDRAAKLALARKKLKDHQEKKQQENQTESNNSSHVSYEHNSQTSNVTNIVASTESKAIENFSNNITMQLEQADIAPNIHNPVTDVSATEILISSKRNLELQINTLQAQLHDLENRLTITTQNYDASCQNIIKLENDLKNVNYQYQAANEQLLLKETVVKELSDLKTSLLDQKSSLQEQLELTKSMLQAKEAENGSLHSQLFNIQNQLDATQLQLQQLTSGSCSNVPEDKINSLRHENEVLLQKVSNLEQQMKTQVKDYQQLNNHYEHYVSDLNVQLKHLTSKNETLNREVESLSNREESLVEQIGDMEIRLQNFKRSEEVMRKQNSVVDTSAIDAIQAQYDESERNLKDLHSKYEELQRLYAESTAQIETLSQSKNVDNHESSENISLLKLNADITSDKLAAQRATEQNKKLKQDIHGLEDAFVKMTKDKLELTEKLAAEKFLNRELTLKLAEIDEKANEMQKTLKAKDEEMIRLQTSCRIIEDKYNEIAENLKNLNGKSNAQENIVSQNDENGIQKEEINSNTCVDHSDCPNHGKMADCQNVEENGSVPEGDAMIKLQERFLKIMDEVADLSDEKHRLEHIITQLQNETDTICEYVALYQQQRCLLKKRDEERSAQIKMFQAECTRLQNQLDELTGILTRFAEDKELSAYFQVEAKHEDIQKVMKLLSKLKTNSLIDPQKAVKFNDFYPCSCCSGQLIEV